MVPPLSLRRSGQQHQQEQQRNGMFFIGVFSLQKCFLPSVRLTHRTMRTVGKLGRSFHIRVISVYHYDLLFHREL